MDLQKIVKRLNEFADLGLGCDWDNIGLLVEPSGRLEIKKVLITNDLTEPVLEEAIKLNVNLVIAYHMHVFKPLQRFTQNEWKQRVIVKCVENRIAVYSPHTAWDSVEGGINDWIINAFDPKSVESIRPIEWLNHPTGFSQSVKLSLPSNSNKEPFINEIAKQQDLKFICEKNIQNPANQVEAEFVSNSNGIVQLIELVKKHFDTTALSSLRIVDLKKPELKLGGLGRIGTLKEAKPLKEIVEKVKEITNLKHFRLALANGKSLDDKINRIAVGAGLGSGLLNGQNADLLITGEFKHHEILDEIHRGVSVIVTDHTNTERCYFNEFKQRFNEFLDKNGDQKPDILISTVNRDPLEVI